MISKTDFINAYMWFNGVSRKEAEVAYNILSDITKQLYIEAFIDNAKRCMYDD